MNELSWAETVRRVHERAVFHCEYCQTGQRVTGQAMHVEHINPSGGNDLDNLCLDCPTCNQSKSQATSASDPETNDSVVEDDGNIYHYRNDELVGVTVLNASRKAASS